MAKNGRTNRGGVTQYYNDHSHTPLHWMKSRIIGGLGGMAAVEQVFGIQDLGASADLDSVFDDVKDLVGDHCVCGFQLHDSGYNCSQDLRERQEQAAAAEVERYYRKAKEIIALNLDFFSKLAGALAEKGLLSMVDIQKIKAECTIVPVAI